MTEEHWKQVKLYSNNDTDAILMKLTRDHSSMYINAFRHETW